MATVFTDSREKARAIKKIISEFESHGIQHFSTKLFVGDYMCPNNPLTFIDRKQDVNEIAQNAVAGNTRFKAELDRMKCIGAKMYILIEQDQIDGKKIESLEDIILWENKYGAVQGERIYRILKCWENKYDIKFVFCKKADTGKKIIELLGAKNE